MDENKKIEKLSETGEQSAEMVSGGVERHIPHRPNRPIRRPERPGRPLNPPALNNIGKKCADCGKSIQTTLQKFFSENYYEGKAYCPSCLAKHKTPAEEPAPSADAGLGN